MGSSEVGEQYLSELVARVGEQHQRVTVTVHEPPAAVLSSAAVRALSEADAELARGEGVSEDDLAAAMQARRAGK
ncbi:type II toxin-antitoxin system prevent-host-death family antitoxin [Mycobacterium sp. EPa45]|uniref:type II toxin-antitoxin system prevent-host-death family antitoxin n=1 Tax=Mycobacterium sp. EPa45 TaxID=1545728 RepID=UPI0011873649|nr:type II toxin-antitoxin system prevent-host-death family antitoxin [Mycobacterium sp. EPa45]